MSRHRVGVRQDDYEDDDYYSQSPGSYPGDSLSSSVERQYMFNRLDMQCSRTTAAKGRGMDDWESIWGVSGRVLGNVSWGLQKTLSE